MKQPDMTKVGETGRPTNQQQYQAYTLRKSKAENRVIDLLKAMVDAQVTITLRKGFIRFGIEDRGFIDIPFEDNVAIDS